MKVLLVVTVLMALASADSVSLEEEFQKWKNTFGKTYKSKKEESQHKYTWLENHKLVQKHNMLADQGNESYRLGMNYFADMSNQEYKESLPKDFLLSFNRTKKHSASTFIQQTTGADLPKTINWMDNGYVNNVTEQGDCHSCWAFSATGALEGQMFKKTGKLVRLSVQQLIDCSHQYRNRGCIGGWMNWAFEYVGKKGLDTEESYPYKARDGDCKFNPVNVAATCTGYVDIISEDEKALQKAVATIGPISAAINSKYLKLYESGVYDEPKCSSTDLDHAVLVVGYGTDDGNDYWLVRNSWGTDWGEHGYIRMSRNKKNQCGIATAASYPLVSNKTQRDQCEAYSAIFVLGYFWLGMFY